jgi:nickel-type superoxide dismutase maturation protease
MARVFCCRGLKLNSTMANNSESSNRPLPSPSWSEWLLWLARGRHRFFVRGNSMSPLLNDGDVVFVDPRAYATALPQVGDVVVARHPYQRDLQIIKRVADVTDDQRVFLESDNPSEGTDSHTFGTIPYDRLLGRVTARIAA